MSDFEMKHRPKKPTQDGQLEHTLYQGIGIPEMKEAVEAFMKKHPHLKEADIYIEYDDDPDGWGNGLMLAAAGKPPAVYEKEMKQYKKELAEYKQWQKDNAEAIALFKVAEKKRIEENKLKRRQAKLLKELEAVEGKLKGK